MAESKDAKYQSFLSLISLLAAANFLFFCLEFILAVEVRSVSLFSDSIVFLEGASASVLMSPRPKWSVPGREGFARFSRTMLLIPTCFMFWMIAANYYGGEIPSAVPLATTGAVLLLTNIAFLYMQSRGMFSNVAGSLSQTRTHAILNTAIIGAAFLTWGSGTMWPDVLVGLGILYMNGDAAEHIVLAARYRSPARHE
jgi:Co/Zn/Cd efflux system component